MKIRWIPAICALLVLGACNETRFESPPGDDIVACDPAWKGLWVDASEPRSSDEPDELAFLGDAECRFFMLERPEKDGPPKQIHIPVNYVHDRGKHYVVVADNQLGETVKLNPVHGIEPVPEKSFFIARYQLDHERLRIWQVDSRRTAHKVIDGMLDGSVDDSHNELHVFISGDRARILDIVRKQKIFEDKPSANVRRSTLSLDEYERQRSARRAGKPS